MKHFGFYVLTFPLVGLQLTELGFSKTKIRHITNGVDFEGIGRIPVTRRKFHACFLGNAISRKGVFDLPQVWSHVCNSMPDAKLAIVGTGREQDIARLQKHFRDRKLSDNVQFLGYLSEYEKLVTLKASSLFLFPSYEEGWGIAISEAMACGLPVVAYDLPAYRTTFKKGMVTVPLGSISDFAHATVMLLKDEVKRVHLGQDGKKQAGEYDLAKIPAAELSLIKEICR
jgi:glycosyltransferase involved in cell wall biosynthesis